MPRTAPSSRTRVAGGGTSDFGRMLDSRAFINSGRAASRMLDIPTQAPRQQVLLPAITVLGDAPRQAAKWGSAVFWATGQWLWTNADRTLPKGRRKSASMRLPRAG